MSIPIDPTSNTPDSENTPDITELAKNLGEAARKQLGRLRAQLSQLDECKAELTSIRLLLATSLFWDNNDHVRLGWTCREDALRLQQIFESLHSALHASIRVVSPGAVHSRPAYQFVDIDDPWVARNLANEAERLSEAYAAFLTVAAQQRGVIGPGSPMTEDAYRRLAFLITTPSTEAALTPATSRETEGEANNRSKGIPRAEAEILVREWLVANAKDNPAGITRDAVAAGTGVSGASVSRTAAWKAFRERRDAEAKPRAREVPLTDAMQAAVSSGRPKPDELAALIEEQMAEEAEQERRHKRRSEPF